MPSNRGHQHKEGRWHSTFSRHKAYLTSLISVYLFTLNLAHCLWGLSRTTPMSLLGKRLNVRGVSGPQAHTHGFPCLGCLGVCTKALTRF